MSSIREKALARLSVAALAVDIMVITLIVIAVHSSVRDVFNLSSEIILLILVPVILAVHFLVVEFIAGGHSIGRFSTGLMVRDELSGHKLKMSTAARRCGSVFICAGLPSVSVTGLPKYNKMRERCLCSDWVGSVSDEQTHSARRKQASVKSGHVGSNPKVVRAAAIGLKVVSGPDKGKTGKFSKGRNFANTNMFVVGRDSRASDLALANDKSVSAIHCRIAVKHNNVLIVDGRSAEHASTTGTFLNNQKIASGKPSKIHPGDVIKVGKTTLSVI